MHTLRTSLLALVLLALAPLTAFAQLPVVAGQQLFFDHTGAAVDSWGYAVDTGAWVTATPTKGAQVGTVTPAVFAWSLPFPAVTPGTHTIKVRACNQAGCAESDAFAFTMVAVPAKPINLRIGTTAP